MSSLNIPLSLDLFYVKLLYDVAHTLIFTLCALHKSWMSTGRGDLFGGSSKFSQQGLIGGDKLLTSARQSRKQDGKKGNLLTESIFRLK